MSELYSDLIDDYQDEDENILEIKENQNLKKYDEGKEQFIKKEELENKLNEMKDNFTAQLNMFSENIQNSLNDIIKSNIHINQKQNISKISDVNIDFKENIQAKSQIIKNKIPLNKNNEQQPEIKNNLEGSYNQKIFDYNKNLNENKIEFFKKNNFKFNPYTGEKILYNEILEENNLANIKSKNINKNLGVDNNKILKNSPHLTLIKEEDNYNKNEQEQLKKLYKYYFYIDSKGFKYKYTINKIYKNQKIYYNCSDSKCNGCGLLILSNNLPEKDKEKNNFKEFIPKKINNKYHNIEWSKHSYNRILYMKTEFEEDKVTKLKLKNPFYRLDFLKELAFRNPSFNQYEVNEYFLEHYGDIEYDFSTINLLIFNILHILNFIYASKLKLV